MEAHAVVEPQLSPDEARSLLEVVEERRRRTLDLIYQSPGLSLTAQAFLFTITLNASTPNTGRVIAACVGVIAGSATAISILKHNYTEEMYAAVIDGIRAKAGLPALHRNDLRILADHEATNKDFKRWKNSRWRRVAKDIPSTDFWIYSLLLFAGIDVVVLVLALIQLAGGPHPLTR
jgi:hypothetical protein